MITTLITWLGTTCLSVWESGVEYTHFIGMGALLLTVIFYHILVDIAFPNWFSEFVITEGDRRHHNRRVNEFQTLNEKK